MELKTDGAEKFAKLSKLLQERAPKELSRALTKAVGQAAAPLKRQVLQSTDEFLPRRGGLAERVSRSRLPHRVRKGSNPKVTITAARSSKTLRDPKRVDRGRIAHPVFGMAYSRAPWQLQDVKPGWFSTPLEEGADIARSEIVKAVDQFTDQIEKLI